MANLKNKQQLRRFALVGGLNTIVDFGLLFVFKSFGIPIGISNVFSTTIAFVVSFFANKKYTFQSSGTHIVREMLLFVIVTLFGLWVLQTIVIQLTLPWLSLLTGDSNLGLFAAKILATGVSMVWNYILYATVVFRGRTT